MGRLTRKAHPWSEQQRWGGCRLHRPAFSQDYLLSAPGLLQGGTGSKPSTHLTATHRVSTCLTQHNLLFYSRSCFPVWFCGFCWQFFVCYFLFVRGFFFYQVFVGFSFGDLFACFFWFLTPWCFHFMNYQKTKYDKAGDVLPLARKPDTAHPS